MNRRHFLPALGLILAFSLSGCLKDKVTKTYSYFEPVFAPKASIMEGLANTQPAEIKSPGKFYRYGQYLFLNETGKGIHIIDNSQPSQPRNIGFLNIPGNVDVAVKGATLYADFYADLLVFDISNPEAPVLVKNLEDVFPEQMYWGSGAGNQPMVIVDWIRHDTTIEITPENIRGICPNCQYLDFASATSGSAKSTGMGGSMARFAIVNDYMYTVDRHSLRPFHIADPRNPEPGENMNAGWDIETIYPFENKLFLGSMGGLFIYNIDNPAQPQKESEFSHARACDPVVADGNYAFVTLREGTSCGPAENQLLVLDVRQIDAPELLRTYSMERPAGLAIDGSLLFICDGQAGLKIFDAGNVLDLKQINSLAISDPYDVMAFDHLLMVVGKDGLYQYSYDDNGNTEFLSKFSKWQN